MFISFILSVIWKSIRTKSDFLQLTKEGLVFPSQFINMLQCQKARKKKGSPGKSCKKPSDGIDTILKNSYFMKPVWFTHIYLQGRQWNLHVHNLIITCCICILYTGKPKLNCVGAPFSEEVEKLHIFPDGEPRPCAIFWRSQELFLIVGTFGPPDVFFKTSLDNF